MSRFSFLAIVLCLLIIAVAAIHVEVDVSAGHKSHHMNKAHHAEHENHENHMKHILPESEVDEAEVDESEVDEAEVDDVVSSIPTEQVGGSAPESHNVPACAHKSPEKCHVSMNDNEFISVAGTTGPNGKCTIDSAGVSLVKSFEGFVGHWYNDGTGVMTIGYGCTSECKGMKSITEAQASAKLAELLDGQYGHCVSNKVSRHLTANQFSALTSFVYNVGCGAISGGLLSDLNAGRWSSATTHIASWNRGGGRVMAGLVRRRTAEIKLFNTKSALC